MEAPATAPSLDPAALPDKQQCATTVSSRVAAIFRNREGLDAAPIADARRRPSRRSPYSTIFAVGETSAIMSGFLRWFFRNRQTGEITIAQAPNLVLWVVIVAGVLRWVWHPPGTAAVTLDVGFKGGLIVWSLDEIFRGVNPWRRCLGGVVLAYELATLL